MKSLLLYILPLFLLIRSTNDQKPETTPESPLVRFSDSWNEKRFAIANTASGISYLTDTEKKVIHILNLFRMDPVLFNKTVVSKYPEYANRQILVNNSYYKSLVTTLKNSSPLSILQVNKECFESAFCHAKSSGESGYVGHDRLNAECRKNTNFFGECISYGYNTPLDIVMTLLIDENVPSLGHRKIFLGNYNTVAVSIQPHKTYRHNAVIDFGY